MAANLASIKFQTEGHDVMKLTNIASFTAGGTLGVLVLDLLRDSAECVGSLDYLSVAGALVTTVLVITVVTQIQKHVC